MVKKIILIVLMSIGFGLLLYFKPWQNEIKSEPRIVDRLPVGEYIGYINPLELSKQIAEYPSFKEIKFRQFLNYDFLISQSRSLGINLQSSVYYFIKEDKSWGIVFEINDPKKLQDGIVKFIETFDFETKEIKGKTIHELSKFNLSISYGTDFLIVYKGLDRDAVFDQVFEAEYNHVNGIWDRFLNLNSPENKAFTMYSEGEQLKNYGFESILLTHISDSAKIILKTILTKENSFNIAIKQGRSFNKDVSKNAIDLQLDISNFRDKKNDLLYKQLEKFSKKYGLPFIDFLNTWEGELSFREGDYIRLEEKYFETELDEEFNPVLEEKIRTTYIPEYNVYLSNNQKFKPLLNQLIARRVAIKEEDSEKYRFLLSPPMNLIKTDSTTLLYSGDKARKLKNATSNSVSWKFKNVRYNFELDSLQEQKAFGKIFFDFSNLIDMDLFQ